MAWREYCREYWLTLYHIILTFNNLEKEVLKTLWEKEKMLVTSIFSFSHSVFYPYQNRFQFFNHIYFVVCKNSILDLSKLKAFADY